MYAMLGSTPKHGHDHRHTFLIFSECFARLSRLNGVEMLRFGHPSRVTVVSCSTLFNR